MGDSGRWRRILYDGEIMDPPAAMFQLALETSSDRGSIALGREGVLLEARAFGAPRDHSASLLAAIDSLCRSHNAAPDNLNDVYVSLGPGSFTGLRIGLTVGRMLALAVGAKVHGVPTMHVIAQNALDLADPPSRVAVLVDARRDRVFAAMFERRQKKKKKEKSFVALTTPIEVDAATFVGEQRDDVRVLCAAVVRQRLEPMARPQMLLPEERACPRAEMLFSLGCRLSDKGTAPPPRALVPLYIRKPDAVEKWERRTRG